MTFRFKLTLWYSLILALLLVIFGGILYFSLSQTLLDNIDSSLWFVAETEAASLLDSDTGEPHMHDVDLRAGAAEGLVDKYVQLLNHEGKVIGMSENLRDMRLVSSQELLSSSLSGQVGFETVNHPKIGALRLISLPLRDDHTVNYIIQVGTSLGLTQEILDSFLFQLLGMGLAGLLLAGSGGWFLARRALKPVAHITETARSISSQSLDKRLDFKVTPDEIGRLIVVLNEMLKRLDEAFSSQKRFIADASHELRSPLTALKGTMEVLLRRKRNVEEYEDGLSSSLDEINRLTRLVNNLLILARTDTAKEEVTFSEFRLDQLIEEVVDQTQVLAQQKKIELHGDIEDEISIKGNTDKIRQLVINLLNNAIRYTPDGGNVQLSLKKEDNHIRIIVTDNGIGIPEGDIPRIFDRFFRSDRSRHRDAPGGSGLGLAICQWIVKIHRGEIKVESETGKGSTFTVLLPG